MPGTSFITPWSGPIFFSMRVEARKSSNVNSPGEQPLLHLLLLVALDGLLGLLDQRQHVPHAEDAGRHPVGVEDLELVELLADRGELHRAGR